MNYFVFKGIDTRTKGIIVDIMPPIQRAKERVTQVTVAGRAGALTLSDGAEAYEPYVEGIAITVPESQIHSVYSWLNGSGDVTFSTDSNRKQKARVINAISFTKVSKHLAWYKGTVQFLCQPFKEKLAKTIQSAHNGDIITNTGDVPERPMITAFGNGTITIGEFTINDVVNGCIIDCEAMEVLDLRRENIITGQSAGEFPSFPTGRSELITTADSLTIERRERYL